MSRCTQTEALHRFSILTDADAGRLRGQCLYHTRTPIPAGTLAPEAAALLHDAVYRRASEPETGTTICYVVSSDGTPVAWLDYQAQVTTPAAALTAYQRAHQQQAVAALSQLSRRALAMLARLRDLRDHRGADPQPTGLDGRVLVAGTDDPTLTVWTRLAADHATTAEHLHALVAGTPLVVDTFGYGDYGRHRDRIDIAMLCVIEELAAAHGLPAAVVGDWLHAEGATTADVTADKIRTAFDAAYAGVFKSRAGYADFELQRRGWAKAMDDHGIDRAFFDTRKFAHWLITHEVRDIALHDYRIAVFRRGNEAEPR